MVEVYLDAPDGKAIDHNHPALVLVVHSSDATCEVVAISTKLSLGKTDYHVEMPSGYQAKSGLTQECVAKPEWHASVDLADCKKIGFVSAKKLASVKASLVKFIQDSETKSS